MNTEQIVKEAIAGRYISYLEDSIRMLNRLKAKPNASKVSVQSIFNLIRMYLDKAEKEL